MDADLFAPEPAPAPPRRWRAAWNAAGAYAVRLWPRTLKMQLLLSSLLAVVGVLGITAWRFGSLAEAELIEQARLREQAVARQALHAVGRELQQHSLLLEAAARRIDARQLDDPQQLASQLLAETSLRTAFANLSLVSADGRMRVLVDAAGARHPDVSVADRPHFQAAMRTGQPTLSGVVQGRVLDEPTLVFVHPLLLDGIPVGVLTGAVRLARADLMAAGNFVTGDPATTVLTDAQGVVIGPAAATAGQAIARLEPFGAWAAAPAAERVRLALAEGQILSHAVDPTSGFQVWRVQPVANVLEPMVGPMRLALRDAALLTALLGFVLAALLARLLRPLRQLQGHAESMRAGQVGGDWPTAGGEIGSLVRTLRHLWAEREQAESFNAQVMDKLGSVMAAAPVGLAFTRAQGFELLSAEFCRLVGRDEADLVGQPLQRVFVSNDDYAHLVEQVDAAFERGEAYAGEWELLRPDHGRFWALLRARPVAPSRPEAGTIWSITDISDQVTARAQLEHAAMHDALTGVVNRQGFERSLQQIFDGQPGTRPASLVMIDLDHFKPVNDTAGHAAGDAMLVAVAQAIASRVRSTDTVVRLGGDEFALLLPHCDRDRAMAVAEKVREAITTLTLQWEAHTLRVGASLGVAELGPQFETPDQWVAQADAACYEAKRAGRGTVRSVPLRVVHASG